MLDLFIGRRERGNTRTLRRQEGRVRVKEGSCVTKPIYSNSEPQ